MDKRYSEFLNAASAFIPKDRIYTDELRRLAWGTDASFYRLIPKIVVRSDNETEVARLLALASRLKLPVTFRAAGTSLSGQSLSDSILIVAGKHWENYSVSDDASTITMQPGIIGGRVNEYLKPYGRMFAPDPASKNSAMVGGIVINNASGMNCGTHANSDKVLRSMRIVLVDGTVLDTGDEASREAFRKSHHNFVAEIEKIRDEIRSNSPLAERIRHKYKIKNVTGLNLLPFVRFDDPFEIIAHLMVGSEGTLAFMSEVTANTSHLYPYSASAMLYFSDIREACRAVVAMKKLNGGKEGPVFSAEMLDRKSLASVNDTTGENLTAVLTETKADTPEELKANIDSIVATLEPFSLFKPSYFTDNPAEYSEYWKIRSGIFPSVGGTRPLGTTSLIEDIAFHIEDLPDATSDLQTLLQNSGYDDYCIYGHALEGNYHFVIAQAFDTEKEIERYRTLMEQVERLVVDRYDGSLKAEHGTGRNMAPFVRKEWGNDAYEMMVRVKRLFDPDGILNPGVIFNDDAECFIKNLKPMPLANDHVNKCIECGFCEVNCVSCGYALSARQRIVVQREVSRLRATGENPERLKILVKEFKELGNALCAGDGLCSTSCPMKINTGEMIHDLRQESLPVGSFGHGVGRVAANHLRAVKGLLRPALSSANAARSIIGNRATASLGKGLHKIGFPLWTPSLPKANYMMTTRLDSTPSERKVVYFPSCINQTMGATAEKGKKVEKLVNVMTRLCEKAGFEVIFPEGMKLLCCGLTWESKGMPDIADRKCAELEAALLKASENGKYPILCDQSPCLHRMRDHIRNLHLYEPVEFIHDFLAPYLEFETTDDPVAIHVTCSARLMGLTDKFVAVAQMCSTNVTLPTEVGCCAFAGDKGFFRPGLNAYALRKLRPQIEAKGIRQGYSNSRTCEIGLTTNSGIPYKSIAYLVDEHTKSKKQ